MLLNFIRISLRYLSKNKTYAIINIFGLALGMACFVLLSLFVEKELSYDEFHEDKELVYQIYLADSGDVEQKFALQMQAPAGPHLVETVPEIVNSARFGRIESILTKVNDSKYIIPKIHYSDANLFQLFDIPLINTTAERVTLDKKQVILSRSEAERLYGSVDEAIGSTFEFVDLDEMEVVAVFEDLPEQTHLEMNVLISFEYANELLFFRSNFSIEGKVLEWGFVSAFPTYIKLQNEEHDLAAIEEKIHTALKPHLGYRQVKLIRLDDVYFSEYYSSYFKAKGDPSQVKLYVIIAIIVLLVAIVNYTNMATARYSRRAKEVGIRKTIGGHRSQIIRQFLVESVSISFISMILAVCMAEMVMPFFNGYTGKAIDISYQSMWTYVILIALSVLIGLLAGIYPSMYLSRFNPLRNLNQSGSGRAGKRFRQVLVGFQFTTCLGLMAVTGIVFSQFNYMQTIDKGFDSEQLLSIELKGDDIKGSFEAFRSEILTSPNVENALGASFSVFDGVTTFYVDIEGMEEDLPITLMMVEGGFLEMLGIEKNVGRMFSELPESEQEKATVINQLTVERAGWEDPIGQTLSGRKVVGVVDDFIYSSAKEEIAPLMVMESSSDDYSTIYIKINGSVKLAMDFIGETFDKFSTEYPFEYKFVDDAFADKYEAEMKLSQVLGIFSALTIFIAGLGILGLSIFIAEQRIKEIGIRRVLGASLGQIVWLLNSGITKLIMVISLITLPAVYYFIQDWLANFAYNIQLNGLYFIAPLLVLLGIVWAILFYQSVRSARANPVNALRTE